MQAVTTIEQFQQMMKSESKEGVLAILQSLCVGITPEDVRKMSDKSNLSPVSSWVGWR